MTTIYHNPRCRKSRETLELITSKRESPNIVEYLKTPPNYEELAGIVDLLGIKPLALIRRNEKVFKEQFKGQDLSDEEWLNVMIENPILIERPVVVKDGKATIGRPPESVLDIL